MANINIEGQPLSNMQNDTKESIVEHAYNKKFKQNLVDIVLPGISAAQFSGRTLVGDFPNFPQIELDISA